MLKFLRWIPALVLMTVIFIASATASTDLPSYGYWDTLVKKGAHMTGYALLASSIWYGFGFERKKAWTSGLLALAYAVSDEFHQSFTPGRHPALMDVLLFDGGGAALGVIVLGWFLRRKNRMGVKKGSGATPF
jgi:VanZ family protein